MNKYNHCCFYLGLIVYGGKQHSVADSNSDLRPICGDGNNTADGGFPEIGGATIYNKVRVEIRHHPNPILSNITDQYSTEPYT